jgi:hypothetical protein
VLNPCHSPTKLYLELICQFPKRIDLFLTQRGEHGHLICVLDALITKLLQALRDLAGEAIHLVFKLFLNDVELALHFLVESVDRKAHGLRHMVEVVSELSFNGRLLFFILHELEQCIPEGVCDTPTTTSTGTLYYGQAILTWLRNKI